MLVRYQGDLKPAKTLLARTAGNRPAYINHFLREADALVSRVTSFEGRYMDNLGLTAGSLGGSYPDDTPVVEIRAFADKDSVVIASPVASLNEADRSPEQFKNLARSIARINHPRLYELKRDDVDTLTQLRLPITPQPGQDTLDDYLVLESDRSNVSFMYLEGYKHIGPVTVSRHGVIADVARGYPIARYEPHTGYWATVSVDAGDSFCNMLRARRFTGRLKGKMSDARIELDYRGRHRIVNKGTA